MWKSQDSLGGFRSSGAHGESKCSRGRACVHVGGPDGSSKWNLTMCMSRGSLTLPGGIRLGDVARRYLSPEMILLGNVPKGCFLKHSKILEWLIPAEATVWKSVAKYWRSNTAEEFFQEILWNIKNQDSNSDSTEGPERFKQNNFLSKTLLSRVCPKDVLPRKYSLQIFLRNTSQEYS